MDLQATFGTETVLIGMVHLPPLPGSPQFSGDRAELRATACTDARTLVESGFDGVMVENFGDRPYHPDDVPKHTVAELTAAVSEIDIDHPLGVNVLRNDATAAVAVGAATGAAFVRVNVHTGERVTDQGRLAGQAHKTVRLREQLDTDISILADVAVKHSASTGERPVGALAEDAIERGLADGVIVSGPATGEPTAADELRAVLDARDSCSRQVPVFIGSGVTADNAAELLELADGAIVGTAVKKGGQTRNRVDTERATELVESVRRS